MDSAHLHLLHLVTVAHLVQILLTFTTGGTWRQRLKGVSMTYLSVRSPVCPLTCLCPDELCMDQDGEESEEEQLTCQLYGSLREHLCR